MGIAIYINNYLIFIAENEEVDNILSGEVDQQNNIEINQKEMSQEDKNSEEMETGQVTEEISREGKKMIIS